MSGAILRGALQTMRQSENDTMRKLLALLFFTITLGTAQGANAGPFEDGEAAWSRGDYATALSMWRPLAAQSRADARREDRQSDATLK